MKNIKLDEFKNSLSSIVDDVVLCGEMYRVDTGNRIDEGEIAAFVVMEEPEYKIMREALQMVITLAEAADKDGNININDLLRKHKNS